MGAQSCQEPPAAATAVARSWGGGSGLPQPITHHTVSAALLLHSQVLPGTESFQPGFGMWIPVGSSWNSALLWRSRSHWGSGAGR